MALTVTYIPGYTFQGGEVITETKLMLAAQPTILIEGTFTASSIADGTVTSTKLATGAVGDATKVANGILTDALVDPNYRKASVVAGSRNLIVKNDGAAPNNKLNITADEVVLKNASGGAYLATAVSVNADITVSGAGGLDTGSEASSTWYYLWLIYNSGSNTAAALLSTSSTAPTLPSGYQHYALIGCVRNDGSSNFVKLWQNDRRIWIAKQNVLSNQAPVGADTYETLSGTNLTTFQGVVPPIAKSFCGTIGAATSGADALAAIAADANGIGETTVVGSRSTLSENSFFASGRFECPLQTSQNFYWKGINTSTHVRVDVSGFTI